MKLSVVVVFHEMRREAVRTLHSLSAAYQRDVDPSAYEVIAIDNGSAAPVGADAVAAHGANFRYRYLETDAVSPVGAVNAGADMARGDLVAVIVDGARMASPGLIANTLRAAALFTEPLVASLSWHLGPDVQNISITQGYDQAAEDRLLDGIGWRENGYELFGISTLAQSSAKGFLAGIPPECSWICLRRAAFKALGGFDARFVSPGGGLVNHHFRDRALGLAGVQPVMILGEGVFHQVHGGVATNVPYDRRPIPHFRAEYAGIVGRDYAPAPAPPAFFLGTLPDWARPYL